MLKPKDIDALKAFKKERRQEKQRKAQVMRRVERDEWRSFKQECVALRK